MLISEWLGVCARSIDAGIPVQGSLAPKGWGAYVAMTLPQGCDVASHEEIASTRVLRFLLAQAIAKDDEDGTDEKEAEDYTPLQAIRYVIADPITWFCK